MDERSFAYFDELRRRHFPPERNFLSAHITLFHHLPGGEIDEIAAHLKEITRRTGALDLEFAGWRSLGRGVAMNVSSPGLAAVREEIGRRWADVLTPQDKQPFRPHITIQNKVEPSVAKRLLTSLEGEPLPETGSAMGLDLWKYLGGPWKEVASFPFSPSVDL